MFIEQSDELFSNNKLCINWDIYDFCTMKCSYCFNRDNFNKSIFPKDYIIDNILLAISKVKLPIFLGILGGEPTLFKNYFKILDYIDRNIISKNELSSCYIASNAIRETSWWEKHKYYKNFYFMFSFHSEYASLNPSYISNFLEIMNIMYNKGFKIRINLVLNNNPDYWQISKDFYEKLYNNLDKYIIHFHYLYYDVHTLFDYSDEFWRYWEFLEEEDRYFYTYIDKNNKKNYYNEYQILKNKLNNFKNWQCFYNFYDINKKGTVNNHCFNENNINNNLILNDDYFANIDKINYNTCTHNSCVCDGLLKVYKRKLC
jgi:hypothetical protein